MSNSKKHESFTSNADPLTQYKSLVSYEYDNLFSDIVFYPNDDDVDTGGRIGLDKCFQSCQGNCIEYGVTGTAYCFPSEFNQGSFQTRLYNTEDVLGNVDTKPEGFLFPNL